MEPLSKSERIAVAFVIVSSTLFCAWCVISGKEKGTITGEVYLKEGGISLAGEQVRIYKGSDAYGTCKTVTTNRKGIYKVSLPAGKYTVAVSDDDYSIDSEQTITLKSCQTVRCRDVVGDRSGYES